MAISFLLLSIPLILSGLLAYQKSEASLDDLGALNLKNSVEMTIEMIEALNDEVEKGSLSLEEAQEKVKVAVLGEKDEDGTRPVNPNLNLGENGYIFVLDQNGIQIAHPNIEGTDVWDEEDAVGEKFVQEMIKVGNEGGGLYYYDWALPNDESRIEPKITYSKTDPHWDWVVNASTYMLDFNQDAKDVLHFVLMITGVALLAGSFIIWIFSNRFSKPITSVSERMRHLASGDLTQEHLLINSKDEVGQLAQTMNQMQTGLKEIILNVANASETIATQSEEFTHAANEVQEGGEQIASTMQELSSGAETQAHNASALTQMMGTFNTKIRDANTSGEEIAQTSQQVLAMTEEGGDLMHQSVTQMENIHQKVGAAVQEVKELDGETREISQLVQVIQDIADQTNLLSLNAAIEAARAGEQGRGFAVVATEVRKLAEQVSDSVEEITTIVNRILQGSEQVVQSLETSYDEVENGASQIKVTGQTFENINASMTDMVDKIQHISSNLQDLARNSGEMNQSIEEVAAVTEESSAGVEQTAASAQQVSSSMDEVASNAEELATLAEQLNTQVNRFKL